MINFYCWSLDNNNLLHFIDTNNNVLIPFEYDELVDFAEGAALAKKDEKYNKQFSYVCYVARSTSSQHDCFKRN